MGETNTTNGCGTEVIDWRNGSPRRPPTKDDLSAITRMVDYWVSSSSGGPTWPAIGDMNTLHELDAAWNNTASTSRGWCRASAKPATPRRDGDGDRGRGGKQRRRPPMSNLIGTVQPLINDKDGIEAALVFAEAGIPVMFVTNALMMMAPATKAGAYVMGFAELVSATVCVQLGAPGRAGHPLPLLVYALDPRTAALTTAPLNHRGLFLLWGSLVHHFGLPAMTGYAGTDDDLPGSWLAAAETAHTVMLAGLVGSEDHDHHRADQPRPAVHAQAHDARR